MLIYVILLETKRSRESVVADGDYAVRLKSGVWDQADARHFSFSKMSRMAFHLFIRYWGSGERLTTPLILVWRLRMIELYLHFSCKPSWCACVCVFAPVCVRARVCLCVHVHVCLRSCAKTLPSTFIRNKTVLIVP